MEDILQLVSFGPEGWGDEILSGAWLTIRLALAAMPFGLALGFLVALAKNSRRRPLRVLGNAFTTIFRGLPELLAILIVYYGGQMLVGAAVGLFSDAQVTVNSFFAGMIALGLIFAAYSSEVLLGAFRNIPRGQREVAYALGFRPLPAFLLVILPYFARLALPGLANLWLGLLKGTSLVSVIGLDDLMRAADIAVGRTKQPFFFFGVTLIVYLAMSIVSSIGIRAIERWSERGEEATT